MKLAWDGTKYFTESDYREKDTIKAAGFRWDPAMQCWWTDDPQKASVLGESEHCTVAITALIAIRNALRAEEDSLQASRATDTEVDIPSPEGLNYLPFQRAGIAYAMSRPGTLIGDEMGLGKTIQICGLINATRPDNVLVICPASLKINWQRELERWLVPEYTIGIASSDDLPDTDIVIINYDILTKNAAALIKRCNTRPIALAVADEAHYVKNPKAQRSKVAVGLLALAERRVLLTGTPIVNRPKELFNLIQVLDPNRWPKFFGYATRYCNAKKTRWGWDFDGHSNLAELQDILRRTVMVRRLKKDVLKDLPPKVRQIIPVPANGYAKQVRAEKDMETRYDESFAELRTARDRADADDNEEAYREAANKLQELVNTQFNNMSRVRHDTAVLKIPAVIAHVEEILEATDKVVLMAHHHDVIDGLFDGLESYNPVSLTGRDNQRTRQDAVDTFQNDPGCRVFIGSVQAAGVGLTLTAASTVVFAELGWTPAEVSQAEDRCHRIGQTDSVLVHHLVIDGSLDARMAHTLVQKQAVLDRALDIEGQINAAPALPEPRKATQRAPVDITIPLEEIALIHEGLKTLAGFDPDGASYHNNMGFSKIDSQFGHSLAENDSLTVKQAWYGRKIIRKYHRQLPEHINKILKEEN